MLITLLLSVLLTLSTVTGDNDNCENTHVKTLKAQRKKETYPHQMTDTTKDALLCSDNLEIVITEMVLQIRHKNPSQTESEVREKLKEKCEGHYSCSYEDVTSILNEFVAGIQYVCVQPKCFNIHLIGNGCMAIYAYKANIKLEKAGTWLCSARPLVTGKTVHLKASNVIQPLDGQCSYLQIVNDARPSEIMCSNGQESYRDFNSTKGLAIRMTFVSSKVSLEFEGDSVFELKCWTEGFKANTSTESCSSVSPEITRGPIRIRSSTKQPDEYTLTKGPGKSGKSSGEDAADPVLLGTLLGAVVLIIVLASALAFVLLRNRHIICTHRAANPSQQAEIELDKQDAEYAYINDVNTGSYNTLQQDRMNEALNASLVHAGLRSADDDGRALQNLSMPAAEGEYSTLGEHLEATAPHANNPYHTMESIDGHYSHLARPGARDPLHHLNINNIYDG